MTTRNIFLYFCLPIACLLLFAAKPAFNTGSEKVSFDQQLQTFQKLGFVFNPGTDTSDLNRWGGHKRYEDQPYNVMYMMLGSFTEREPHLPLTNKCWHLDRELIKAKAGYTDLLHNLERISNGELVLEKLKESIDLQHGLSNINFEAKGKLFSWKLHVADGAFDSDFFSNLVELCQQTKTIRQFTILEMDGENLVIGFENKDGLYAIRKATGMHISWLN